MSYETPIGRRDVLQLLAASSVSAGISASVSAGASEKEDDSEIRPLENSPCAGDVPVFSQPVWAAESSLEASGEIPNSDSVAAKLVQVVSYNGSTYDLVTDKWVHTFTLGSIARSAAADPDFEPDSSELATDTEDRANESSDLSPEDATLPVEPDPPILQPPDECDSDVTLNSTFSENQIVADVDSDHVEIRTEQLEEHHRYMNIANFSSDQGEECPIDNVEDPAIFEQLFSDDDLDGDSFDEFVSDLYDERPENDLPEGSYHLGAINLAMGGAAMLAGRIGPVGAVQQAVDIGQLLWESWGIAQEPDEEDYTDAEFSAKKSMNGLTSTEGHQITFDVVVDPAEDDGEEIPLTFVSNFGEAPDSDVWDLEEIGDQWEVVTEVDIHRQPEPEWSPNDSMHYEPFHRRNQANPRAIGDHPYDQLLFENNLLGPSISITAPDEVDVGESFELSGSVTVDDDSRSEPLFYIWGIDGAGDTQAIECDVLESTLEDPEFVTTDSGFPESDEGTATVDLVIVDQTGLAWHQSTEFDVIADDDDGGGGGGGGGGDPSCSELSADISGPTSVELGNSGTWSSNSTGDGLSYEWGGDVSGSGSSVTETLNTDETYTIQLTVTDECGNTDSATQTVSVWCDPCPYWVDER